MTSDSFVSPTSQRIAIGPYRIYYERHGSGPPLLLVHGLSGSSTWWRRNIPALMPHFTVYTIDLIGFGHSRRLFPLTVVEAADMLAEFITTMGHERADIIAHSMGGHITLLLAARHPEKVGKLVLAAAAGGPAMQKTIWEMMVRALLAGFFGAPSFLPTIAWDALRAGPLVLWIAANDLLRSDLSSLLEQIRSPSLLLWGDRDVLVPLRVGRELKTHLPNSSLHILRGAGHVLMFDKSEAFNQAVLGFLVEKEY